LKNGSDYRKYLTISAMPVAAWVVLQRLIPTGERSGLLTRIAAMRERFVV